MQAAPRVISHRIESIQCLRAIAALLVVVDHAMLTFVSGPGAFVHYSVHDTTRVAESLGSFGVEVFFLISGFIMTSTMYGRFGTPGASADFLWKRLIRIVSRVPMDEGFAYAEQKITALFASPEAAEGMMAFVEKRKPSWAS